jgi:Response regulator containing a CheY-like receiver domain and an HTH DNA-binding domain
MVRVLLAVAHSSLRAALEECLMRRGEMSCDTAATPEELWNRLSQNTWDVLILDLRLPEQTKRATVHTLHERYPDLPILVLSLNLAVPFSRWQEAGARGFLAKAKLSTELIEAVRIISQGGKYFPEDEHEGEREEKIP